MVSEADKLLYGYISNLNDNTQKSLWEQIKANVKANNEYVADWASQYGTKSKQAIDKAKPTIKSAIDKASKVASKAGNVVNKIPGGSKVLGLGGAIYKGVPALSPITGFGTTLDPKRSTWDRAVGVLDGVSGVASFFPATAAPARAINWLSKPLYGVDDWYFNHFGNGDDVKENIKTIADAPVPTGQVSNTNTTVNNKVPVDGLEPLPELDAAGNSDLLNNQANAMPNLPAALGYKDNTIYQQQVQPRVIQPQAMAPTSMQYGNNTNTTATNVNTRAGYSYDPSAILGILDRYLAAGAPVNEAMVEAIQRYPQNTLDTQRQQRFWNAVAGYTGNDNFASMANNLTPIQQVNDQIALRQNLMNQNRNDIQRVGDTIASMDMAAYTGMPASVALMGGDANKELAKLPISYMNLLGKQYTADAGLQGRIAAANIGADASKYVSDNSYNLGMYKAQLDNAIKKYIAEGDWASAQAIQNMKNQMEMQTTFLQQMPWTTQLAPLNQAYYNMTGINPLQPAPGLDATGYATTGAQTPLNSTDSKAIRGYLTKLGSRK